MNITDIHTGDDTMTTTDKTKEIRARLKALGFSSRKVSVRTDPCTYDSAIRVKVKDASVPFHMVKAIVDEYASIDRCEFSGEILSGGNTYTRVSHTSEAEAALAARYVEAVAAAVARIERNFLETVTETTRVGGADFQTGFRLWIDSQWVQQHNRDAYGYAQAAYRIALADDDQQDNR